MAKEFHSAQEAGNEESTTLLKDPYEEEEEEEDTLSLSDLPIYSDNSISAQRGHGFSKEVGENSPPNNDDEDDDDFFEFFSEEFTTSTRATAENIIFCGKLIPFKDPPLEKGKKNIESNTIQKGTALLPWWAAKSFDKAKSTSKDVTSCDDDSFKKQGQEAKGAKSNFSCEYSSSSSVGKVSLMRSTTKSRWFVFMFGMSRLSNTEKMEMRDIRSRQRRSRSRRGPVVATMFPSSPVHGEEGKIKARRNCKGLWKVLRSISLGLGCNNSSKLASDVVKAGFL